MSKVLGLDCSKWQGEMDWSVARVAGAKFAFIRAGSISNITGIPYTDYQFETNARIAPDYMPVGFYWYFRPQFDPVAQAEYFCNLIKDKRWKLPPVLDLEDEGGLSAAEVTEAAKIFIIEVFVNLDVWPLLYSRAQWLNNHTVDDEVWDFVNLWVARYKEGLTGPWSDGFSIPRDFDEWVFWQFSADTNNRGAEFGAKSKSIDLNYFNGDEDDFLLYLGAELMSKIVMVGTQRNAVLYDGVDGKREHIIPYGLHFPVLESKEAPDGRIWYRLGDGWWAVAGALEEVE